MWAIWLRLLAANPHTTLRLRQGQHTRQEHDLLVATLSNLSSDVGVAPARLQFLRKVDTKAHHLERMAAGSHLFLDTDSYSAHSTALDALWAGVPLLTFPGASFASRAPSSFLAALDVPQLIARTIGEYEAMAGRLVASPVLLRSWRQCLWRHRLDPALLFNEARMVRGMLVSFKILWDLAVALGSARRMHVVVV